ncbi:MAG: glycosyltransferase family 4 protein [Mangrovibacterium sp.]
MEKEYNCYWHFGDWDTDIKCFDTSKLKNVQYHRILNQRKRIYWENGLTKLIKSKQFDTFFMHGETHNLSCWCFFLLKRFFYRKKKVFLWTHGWYGKETKIEAFLKMWMYRTVDGIFTYGDYARRLLMERGISQDKVFVIHNALHYEEQLALRNSILQSDIYKDHFGNNDPTIIFIGRLTKAKRLDLLIDALSELTSKGLAYNLVLVGNGVKRDELEKQTKKLCMGDRVWFFGACYDEKTNAELIYNASLCVSPGNIGLTAMHVLMFGTPVATHNNYAYQGPEFEAIHEDQTGTFFIQNNVDSIVNTIERWFVTKVGKREEIRVACYKEIDDYWTPQFQIRVIKEHIK